MANEPTSTGATIKVGHLYQSERTWSAGIAHTLGKYQRISSAATEKSSKRQRVLSRQLVIVTYADVHPFWTEPLGVELEGAARGACHRVHEGLGVQAPEQISRVILHLAWGEQTTFVIRIFRLN